MWVAAYTGSSQGGGVRGKMAVTPVRTASGAPASPRSTVWCPTRTPSTSVIALAFPGSPLPMRMPRSRDRGCALARYDTGSPMGILGLGVSFRRAPVELLERLSFTDDDLTKAYRVALDQPGVEGAVLLSTCNRVEIYGEVASYHAGFLALKRVLSETR